MQDGAHVDGNGTDDFEPARLSAFLRGAVPGAQGPMHLQRIGGGQSNPTYFVSFDERRLVLRKQPGGGKLLPSAHAVDREYRILNALAGSAVPVPRTVLYCDDAEVVGTPFYLMDRLEGRVFPSYALPDVAREQRTPMLMAMADTLAALHGVDWKAIGPLPRHAGLSDEAQVAVKLKQGRGVWGVQLKLVDAMGQEAPWDGRTPGHLHVRGPWIASGYLKSEGGPVLDEDGWFPTGDIATVDADGYVQMVDRAKDVIKSGGEWISSLEVENHALSHPAVAEAALMVVPHPKWQERPLLVVVRKAGREVTRDELLAFLAPRMAKWRLPDDVVFVEELPHTATGKLLKVKFREQYRGYRLSEDSTRRESGAQGF